VDKSIQIQLGSEKNINSTNVDIYDKIILNNQRKEILEYNIRNVLSTTEVFETERQNTQIYRIYGSLNYLSTLNGLYKKYKILKHFFKKPRYEDLVGTSDYKNVINSFDFYLVKPIEHEKILATDNEYITKYEVIATPEDFEIYNAGYSVNIFNERSYSFIFNKDFDVTNWIDDFNFPITELYLHPVYKRTTHTIGVEIYDPFIESMSATTWSSGGSKNIIPFSPTNYNIGDIIYGDKINYQKNQFLQTNIEPQIYYISTPYLATVLFGFTEKRELQWKYNPFIPFKLRYFSNQISRANTGGTAYDETSDIPYYATHLGDGNMIWRDILEQGYIDPLTGDGVDYPFVNKRRYLFSNVLLNVIPNMDHPNTAEVFNEIKFGKPTSINYNPLDDLNKIGKPC
jgi:hypothetical protein